MTKVQSNDVCDRKEEGEGRGEAGSGGGSGAETQIEDKGFLQEKRRNRTPGQGSLLLGQEEGPAGGKGGKRSDRRERVSATRFEGTRFETVSPRVEYRLCVTMGAP